METRKPNQLIHETSPYLLQHAYNPVAWFAWNDAALQKAQDEDKLLLISIGYSACHWCHVMEHESFEDAEVAEIMNRFFICIKVDREERPDIDQVYMTAVQLMTGRGGWPLNCFALPDGKPVYGGTYYPKETWKNILLNLAEIYKNDKPRFLDYGQQLTDGIKNYELIPPADGESIFDKSLLTEAIAIWSEQFDNIEGGPDRAPKFPLPNNYLFFLQQYFYGKDEKLKTHLELTLKKMEYGGIYDQVGGGFARYSVDALWKVPHFEKMLYDNSQLVSLYSEAYRFFKDPEYKNIVYESLEFIERELTGDSNNFYSALDADSEGVEGLFYTWTKEELIELTGEDFNLFEVYYNVNDTGYWEEERYILLRKKFNNEIASQFKIKEEELLEKVSHLKNILLKRRESRIRPGLDDKTITGWNALMSIGYLDAYIAFGEEKFFIAAKNNLQFIEEKLSRKDGGLYRNYKNGNSTINAYLEDYAFYISALIKMYRITFDETWINKAKSINDYVESHFSDDANCFYYFTSDLDPPLIARKMELHDNVIPASNSQMGINLFELGHYLDDDKMIARSKRMLTSMKKFISNYGSSYSNWLILYIYHSQPIRELVICGSDALKLNSEISRHFLPPGILIGGAVSEENLPMTKGRLKANQTLIYICKDKTCNLPVDNIIEALDATMENADLTD